MRKNNFVLLTIVSVLAIVCIAFFAACDTISDTVRKLQGAEVNFPDKVSAAEQLSFDLDLTYEKGEETTNIKISCFKKADEYAYDFYLPDSMLGTKYRNLYADNKEYEVVTTGLNVGSYYVIDNVGVDSEDNLLYWVCQNIMAVKVAALVTTAKQETLNGETVYRYDLTLNENDFSFWYNKSELIKLSATIVTTDEESQTTSTEKYTAEFSNYKFENVDSEVFTRPEDLSGIYRESPISFEDWVSIISDFGSIISAAR